MRRLLALALAAVFLALVLVPLGRSLARRPRAAAPAPPESEIDLLVRVGSERIDPARAEVPKDHRVRLTILNGREVPIDLRLAGYDDRLRIGRIEAGATWHGSFVSDRPGEDFPWLVDGEPRGKLAVTGSHLEEGHR